ncbi:MAG: LuxR C-terminal-related transcriptional regulator [[Clostridium] fimetarium]|nr:LuxR C-terminal-related transcriptional regulator [Alistipes timonensis]MCM1405647.1 LuxR C-terminal-related transcriptional regulator [[Clostridium] fimetarium]
MLTLLAAATAVAAGGFVPVRNFTRESYGSGAQNWECVQDSAGRIYVANRDGMLAFDGSRWKRYTLPNFTTVRSLMFEQETGRIYAGGSGEFGYFSPDSVSGELVYTSLSAGLPELHPPLSEVWKIVSSAGRVWFQSDYHLLCLNDGALQCHNAQSRISRTSPIGGSAYVALDNGNILRIDGDHITTLGGTERLAGKKITAILPFNGDTELLIGTSVDGLYRYDGTRAEPYDCDINRFLKDNQLFSAARQGDSYVFGTVNRGAVVKNFRTGEANYINKETGLQNNTVLASYFDQAGNLWLSLDDGLDYAVYNTARTNLTGPLNPIGAGYTSTRRGDRVYLGTNQGLYSAPYPFRAAPSPMTFRREANGQVWSITDDGATMFVATDAGIYIKEGDKPMYRVGGIGGTMRARPLAGSGNLALASTYQKFHLLERGSDGLWADRGPVEGYDDIAGDFIQDRQGDIWIPHWRKGVYRLRFDPAAGRFAVNRLYSSADGLPDNNNNTATLYKGRVVFSASTGFFRLDPLTDRIVRDEELGAIFPEGVSGSLKVLSDSMLAVLENSGIDIAVMGADGKFEVDTTTFKGMRGTIIPGFSHLDLIADGQLLVSTQDGFWNIDPRRSWRQATEPLPFVSAVYANRDSLVYREPTGSRGGALRVPYSLNSLRFDFACPEYRSDAGVEFSSYLKDYDSDWTPFSTETSREYTRLPEGNYTLYLRSRNNRTGAIEETSFTLRVSPPWYRTGIAKGVYVALVGLALFLVYWLLKRWIGRTQRELEQKKERELDAVRRQAEQESLVKDFEIATLKSEQLEQDIKHKSQELSSTTMNLIRKNEILQEIATKLAKIQELSVTEIGAPAAQRMLSKIQTSIEDSISHDNDWKTFNQNFDIVYANYTKRLMELHPNLSAADKRLCCYIKMGLSSKEIAPLINISYKSVEMARYRLRKKMNLPAEASLTSYLDNL